jgi:hypothetical protein
MGELSLPPNGRRHQLDTHIYAAIIGGRPLVEPVPKISPGWYVPLGWYAPLSGRIKRKFYEQMPLLKVSAVKRLAEAKSRISRGQAYGIKPSNISSRERVY